PGPELPGGAGDDGFGGGDGGRGDVDGDPPVHHDFGGEVLDVGAAHVELFAASGVGVHLELEGVGGDIAGGAGLVVDDGQGGGDAVLLVEDDGGPAGDGDPGEVQFEGPFGFPHPVQVVGVVGDVGVDEFPGGPRQFAVGGLVGGGQEEALVEDVVQSGGVGDGASRPGGLGDGAQHVVDGFAVAELGGEAGLEPDEVAQPVGHGAVEVGGQFAVGQAIGSSPSPRPPIGGRTMSSTST